MVLHNLQGTPDVLSSQPLHSGKLSTDGLLRDVVTRRLIRHYNEMSHSNSTLESARRAAKRSGLSGMTESFGRRLFSSAARALSWVSRKSNRSRLCVGEEHRGASRSIQRYARATLPSTGAGTLSRYPVLNHGEQRDEESIVSCYVGF